MLEIVLDHLQGVLHDLGVGFHLSSGYRISSTNFVDNLVLLARNLDEYKFMIRGVTEIIWDRYRRIWKPESLKVLRMHAAVASQWKVECNGVTLSNNVTSTMYAPGGVLDA